MLCAICMVVRNEIDEIPQWILHHLNLGFDRTIIYGNGATDGSAELIDTLAAHLPIEHVAWPTPQGVYPSLREVFGDCLRRFGGQYDWIAFVDADEYLVPQDPSMRIGTLLEAYADHSALAINWLIFGSSGLADTNGRLILDSFVRRAEDQFSANRNVKSIVRPSRTRDSYNQHVFDCEEPYIRLDHQPIAWGPEGVGVVREGQVLVGSLRVHHYMIRSLDHWRRRLLRGNDPKGASWEEVFSHHDRNEVEDRTALPWADRLGQAMAEHDVWALIEQCRTDKTDRRLPLPAPAAAPEPAPALPSPPAHVAGDPAAAAETAEESGPIECHLDLLSPSAVRGWAINLVDPTRPLRMVVEVDGQVTCEVTCDLERADVHKAGYATAAVGFEFVLQRRFFNAQPHRLAFRSLEGEPIPISTLHERTEIYEFSEKWKPAVRSLVDGMHEGVIKGWVLREEQEQSWVGACNLVVTCDGAHVATLKANRHRGDVGKAMAGDPDCGFEFLPPMSFRKARPQAFRFFVAPYDIELVGSPYTTSFVSDGNEAALLDLNDTLDRLYVEMTRLRRQVKTILPKQVQNITDYDGWARRYQEALQARVGMERHDRSRNLKHPELDQIMPLVTILCPTWNPKIGDFCAAIESVIAQTYGNWELIIIDDGSMMPDLSAQIEAFAKRDPRIRPIRRMKNAGISAATNLGIKAARGEWIVFFDHDDLMAPVAIELMVSEARRTGARMLYSDEDKIDQSGYFSEPAFKTDWNYRLLLSCNYICHLVMLDQATVRKVGLLDARYNGAQDHDYLLRVSEALTPDQIHHVPEVLYHWRKSETSTASSTGAKGYAVQAGIEAVSHHLIRREVPARVSNFNDSTWYRIDWLFTEEPSVTIIIPYREQIKITRNCIDCILAGTEYGRFDVVLMDNWSTSEEAMAFAEEMNRLDNVRVMRVEEEFNYSRINNLGARSSNADLFVLMNNDLFVTDKSWLRTLVNEALADDRVGIVGGKFLYPNRRVQHAGVVLGVGGVACHSHLGIGESDPGYAARALFAQELSAVTAACLLVRSDVFWSIGGLDEEHLTVAFNDVDLCIKVRLAGYKVIWTPDFVAEHHESLSRGSDEVRPEKEARFFHEMQTMIERYGDMLKNDPFYSKHFTLEHRPFYDLADAGAAAGRSAFQPGAALPALSQPRAAE